MSNLQSSFVVAGDQAADACAGDVQPGDHDALAAGVAAAAGAAAAAVAAGTAETGSPQERKICRLREDCPAGRPSACDGRPGHD